MSRSFPLAAVLAAVLLPSLSAAGIAAAQPAPMGTISVPAGHHTHDGFYVRGILGFNFTTLKSDTPEVKVSGPGGSAGLALGYTVAPNLIVYAEIYDDLAVSPTVELMGATAGTSDDTSAGVLGFGAGLAYYFMPVNVYVSATLGASQVTVNDGDMEVASSKLGFGASVMVGKEWWVSSDWGIGAALKLFGGAMKDKGDNAPTWTGGAAALMFSATFN